jgi:hypothetical protein
VSFTSPAFLLVTESARHRRQYNGYGDARQYGSQYGSQYGLYGPGGQGWSNSNNMNDLYSNPQGYGGNNNFNWNNGNRRPEWYYNTANTIQSSFLCFSLILFSILVV